MILIYLKKTWKIFVSCHIPDKSTQLYVENIVQAAHVEMSRWRETLWKCNISIVAPRDWRRTEGHCALQQLKFNQSASKTRYLKHVPRKDARLFGELVHFVPLVPRGNKRLGCLDFTIYLGKTLWKSFCPDNKTNNVTILMAHWINFSILVMRLLVGIAEGWKIVDSWKNVNKTI